jgi:Kazal-type serine protease inhibitor domain
VTTTFLFLPLTASGACKSGRGTALDAERDDDAAPRESTLAGCHDNDACAADEYCAQASGLCGRGQSAGTCRRKPISCDDTHAPVCGCDGNVYANECAARAARVDLSAMGRCRSVPDWASCGATYCNTLTSYCEIYLSDVLEPPTTYSCKPLPPACKPAQRTPRSCDCFPAGTPCLTFCGFIQTGGLAGFHLTCQGVKEPQQRPRAF